MLREHREIIGKIRAGMDFLCIFLAWGGAYFIVSLAGTELDPFTSYALPFFVFSLAVVGNLFLRKFRPEEHLCSPVKVVQEIVGAVVGGGLFVIFVFYLFKFRHMSRLFLFTSCALSLALLLIWNLLIHLFHKMIRERGLNYQHIFLVGNEHTLPPVINSIQSNPSLGQKIEAVLLVGGDTRKELKGFPLHHDIKKITKILDQHVIDNVLFTVYRQDPCAIEKAMLLCQERGIKVWLKPDFVHQALISRVDYLDKMPLFVFSLGPEQSFSLASKRLFDVISSALLLVILAIPMGLIALWVSRDAGPVLFKQKRVGLNGRHFIILKFRTMHKDADLRRAEYNLKNEMKGPVFKMKNDPRITRAGKFLRKYSLDELPQIWNVFIGNMSLVGPRPPLPSEVDLYKGWQRRRLSMRPGITCLWQVSGRNKITDFSKWARLDLEYIDKWSLWGDLKILLKTIPVVIKGTGL